MTINVERVEVVGIGVTDLDKAQRLLSQLFDIEFLGNTVGEGMPLENVPLKSGDLFVDPLALPGGQTRIAIDRSGLFELVEGPMTGPRNIHFRVSDIDAATEEMQKKGIRVVGNVRDRGMREVIFHRDDLFGIRLCFVEYTGPSLIEAMLGLNE
jgi:catechol 2,3-dioxygenase-like lactoylglutathione lyase family enzyme